jgi:hypothetical protein
MRRRFTIRWMMAVIAVVALGLWGLSFLVSLRDRQRARVELELMEAMRAQAEAMRQSQIQAHATAKVLGARQAETPGELERLCTENEALRARVRELEQKLGVSGGRPGPAPASGAPSP